MTSVPKPLKFLRPFYPELQEVYESWPSPSNQQARKAGEGEPVVTDKGLFADILSVLAMTYSDTGKRETLAYRLKGGSEEDPGLWGNEYVR
jgi:26S proteasome regulatory subunit N1